MVLPRGRRGQDPSQTLMTDYIRKMSGRATKRGDEAIDPIESLKGLITSGFAKLTTELKDFRKDIQNIDARLTVIEQNTFQLQSEFAEV